MSEKVVITGMGAICPLGSNVNEIFENAKKGVCGIDEITLFDKELVPDVKFVGEVKDFDPSEYIKKEKQRDWIDLHSLLCMLVCRRFMTADLLTLPHIR